MSEKKIESVFSESSQNNFGEEYLIHNFISNKCQVNMERLNPFIYLDYYPKSILPANENPDCKCIESTPHRGFELNTILYKGKVVQCNSAGNERTINEGEVQWLTIGSGILQKFQHEKSFAQKGGEFHMIHLWVNLPSIHKMSKPKYQVFNNQTIEKVQLPNQEGHVEIIAGEFQNQKGSASTFTDLHIQNVKLNKGAKVQFNFPAHYNTSLLVIDGGLQINQDQSATTDQFVLFDNQGEIISIQANENSIFLILSGEPIPEPIVAKGPFVMNSQEEILQAFHDYNIGKFGYLED